MHRLVAETFIPNPKNYPCVNHIDSNRTNNNINNLEWCTYEENTQWALKSGRFDNMSKQNSIRLKNNPLNGYIYANEINELDIFSYQERVIKEIVKKDDEYTKQVIKDYFIKKYPNENIKFDFLDEEIVDEIIKLGIAEYKKRQALGGVLSER